VDSSGLRLEPYSVRAIAYELHELQRAGRVEIMLVCSRKMYWIKGNGPFIHA